jgi:hypothetical protein
VQKDAAELLSISPRVMNYKIKTLGIEFPRGRRAAPLPSDAAGDRGPHRRRAWQERREGLEGQDGFSSGRSRSTPVFSGLSFLPLPPFLPFLPLPAPRVRLLVLIQQLAPR